MNQFFRIVSLAATCALTAVACSTASPERNELACGPRINVDDVLVVDLESHKGSMDEADQWVLEQAGPYTLLGDEASGVLLGGSKASAVARATRGAAFLGCDLLLVVGTSQFGTWVGGDTSGDVRPTYHHYLMAQAGSRNGS